MTAPNPCAAKPASALALGWPDVTSRGEIATTFGASITESVADAVPHASKPVSSVSTAIARLVLTTIWPLDFAPAPLGHGCIVIGLRPRLRVDDGQTRTPLEIANQRRADFRVIGHAQLIGGFKQQGDPAAPLLLDQMPVEMLLNHMWVSPMQLGVGGGPAQHLGKKGGNVRWMIVAHMGKHRGQQGIALDMLVEARSQTTQGIHTAQPFVQRRNIFGHA